MEIYALLDPDDGTVRYIGKARCSRTRLKTHISDARKRNSLVHIWIRGLGSPPLLKVLEVCLDDQWKVREKELIAAERLINPSLLNVANGGNEPFCPPSVRAENGRMVAKLRVRDERAATIYRLKRNLAQALRRGELREDTKTKLRLAAVRFPHLFSEWADIA